MSANFVEIESFEHLDALFEKSFNAPVALLKHSNTCGISLHVYEQVAEVDGTVNVIVIQNHRPISNALAEKTGQVHQSPQAFVIKDGKTIYHATHYGIDPKKIEESLKS